MTEARRSLAAYLVAMLACAALLVVVFELWRADFRVPFSYGADSVCTQLWAKGVVENGWFLTNPRLGAPFVMEMHDFPLDDSLFFGIERLLALTTSNPALVVHLLYFGTYFLTTAIALAVLRQFGVPRVPAVVSALLYAFLPYHIQRGERHLFLSSYFLVPLAAMICLWIYRDGALLFREDVDGRARLSLGNRKALAALAICALLGSGGVYYAAFTCYLLLVAGLVASITRRRVHPLGSAVVLIGLVAAGVAANVAPTVLYAREHGPNAAVIRREAAHVESLGLKVAQMLMPVHGHRIEPLARLRKRYDGEPISVIHESGSATLGAVGGLGFLTLLGVTFLRKKSDAPRLLDGLAALNLAALLLATTGGFGTIIGYVVSPIIRGYNRMSVFIAFFALTAVALGLTRLVRPARPGWPRLAANLALGAVLAFGIFDQTNRWLLPEYEDVQAQFASDAEFVGRIEAALPAGSMVFQLPLQEFPEGSPPGKMGAYDPARAYLHSKSLRWTFGAMKGRYADTWQKAAVECPLPETLRTIALAGFSGIWVDRKGYTDHGAAIEADLTKATAVAAIASRDDRFAFYDLTAYVTNLRRELGPDRWAAASTEALRPMTVTWHDGFYGREEGAGGVSFHWSDGSGEIRIDNPSGHPRRVDVSMGLGTMDPAPARVTIRWPDGMAEYAATDSVTRSMVVPPGGTKLKFHSNAKQIKGDDPRTLAFRVERLRVTEANAPGVAVGAGATMK